MYKDNVTRKWLTYVSDRKDGLVKLFFMPKTILKTIADCYFRIRNSKIIVSTRLIKNMTPMTIKQRLAIIPGIALICRFASSLAAAVVESISAIVTGVLQSGQRRCVCVTRLRSSRRVPQPGHCQ